MWMWGSKTWVIRTPAASARSSTRSRSRRGSPRVGVSIGTMLTMGAVLSVRLLFRQNGIARAGSRQGLLTVGRLHTYWGIDGCQRNPWSGYSSQPVSYTHLTLPTNREV